MIHGGLMFTELSLLQDQGHCHTQGQVKGQGRHSTGGGSRQLLSSCYSLSMHILIYNLHIILILKIQNQSVSRLSSSFGLLLGCRWPILSHCVVTCYLFVYLVVCSFIFIYTRIALAPVPLLTSSPVRLDKDPLLSSRLILRSPLVKDPNSKYSHICG